MAQPRLILGTPAALETALGDELGRSKSDDPLAPVTILVGSTLLRPYLRRRLAQMLGGHINVALVTFAELALRLGEPALIARGRSALPPLARQVLARQVAAGACGYFKPVAGAPGFGPALQWLLRDLGQAAVDPASLAEAAGRTAANPDKLAGICALFDRYRQRRSGFYDSDDCIAQADPARLGAEALLVYGVWLPTATQRALLEQVAARTPAVFLLPETGTDADCVHEPMRAWLASLGAEVERAPEPGEPDAEHGALRHLQRCLFAPDGAAPGDDSVLLVSAPDPPREAVEAARACLRWAREGIAFHEMAVTYRHTPRYRPLVESVFAASGIPLYIHDGTPLAERPLGRRALALLDLVGSDLERAAVMELLTDAELPAETARRFGGIDSAAWDEISRRAGVVAGRDQWAERLPAYVESEEARYAGRGREPPAALRERAERLAAFVDELADRLHRHPERASWSGHVAYATELLSTYIAGVEPVTGELAKLAQLDPLSERVDFERFRSVAAQMIREMREQRLAEGSSGSFARQGVNVLDVNSLRHLRFRAVAVLGLTERLFPPLPRQDALLLDRERRALNEAGGFDVPLRAAGPDPEPLQFALCVQAATERLQLSFARTETGDTSPKLPSHFYRAAAGALVGRPLGVAEVDGLPPHLFRRVAGSRFAAPSLDAALSAGEYDRTLLSDRPGLGIACVAARGAQLARARAAHRARWHSRRLTVHDGVLGERARGALATHSGLAEPMSASAVEQYAACPFRYFLSTVLGLRPLEQPEQIERIDARERGTLVHQVLERFMSECGASDRPAAGRRAEHLELLARIAGEVCDEFERQGLTGLAVLWHFDRRAIGEDLVRWYDHEVADATAFDRGAWELSFGFGDAGGGTGEGRAQSGQAQGGQAGGLSAPAPLEIDAGAVTLRFHGKIDRLDWRSDGSAFRVIDYKSGGRDRQHGDGMLCGGRALQLPIYLLAAAGALGLDWRRGGAQYFYVSSKGGFERVSFDGDDLARREGDFKELLAALAAGIAAGDFHPVPGERRANCRICDFEELCDVRIQALAERKSGDRRAAGFARLGEIE